MKTTFKNPLFSFLSRFFDRFTPFFLDVVVTTKPCRENSFQREDSDFQPVPQVPCGSYQMRISQKILESHSADWYLREHGEWRTKGRPWTISQTVW